MPTEQRCPHIILARFREPYLECGRLRIGARLLSRLLVNTGYGLHWLGSSGLPICARARRAGEEHVTRHDGFTRIQGGSCLRISACTGQLGSWAPGR